MCNDQVSVHDHELPQAGPNCHLLLSFKRLLLRQAVFEELEDIMLMGHKCAPCNASKLCLNSKGDLRELVGRAAAGEARSFPDSEETIHCVDLGDEVVLQ